MHTFELTSPKVSISLRFPMKKKDFSLLAVSLVRLSERLFKYLIIYYKKGVDLTSDLFFRPFNYRWINTT